MSHYYFSKILYRESNISSLAIVSLVILHNGQFNNNLSCLLESNQLLMHSIWNRWLHLSITPNSSISKLTIQIVQNIRDEFISTLSPNIDNCWLMYNSVICDGGWDDGGGWDGDDEQEKNVLIVNVQIQYLKLQIQQRWFKPHLYFTNIICHSTETICVLWIIFWQIHKSKLYFFFIDTYSPVSCFRGKSLKIDIHC